MKNLIIALFVSITVISCNSVGGDNSASEGEYLIEGTIANTGGSTVFLDKLSFVQNSVVDTAIIANDGTFKMKGNIKEKGLYLIRLNQQRNWLMILDEGKYTFTADAEDIYNYNIEGSDESKACAKFIMTAGQNQQKLNQLNQQFNQARMTGDGRKLVQIQQEYQKIAQESQQYIRSVIDTSKYTLVALFAASLLQVEENVDYLDKFLRKAQKELPNSSYVAELKGKVQNVQQRVEQEQRAEAQLGIGKEAPGFTLKSPKGKELPLSSMRGKVVLVDFWASWCRPCRVENPNLVRMYEKYKSKGFDVYSVSLDKNLQRWVQAIEADNLKWNAHGSNLKGWQCDVARMYNVSSIPNTYLLDEEGKIIAKNLRGARLEDKLEEIFGS